MASAAELLTSLETEVSALETKFLSPWIPALPEHTPVDFQHDVKAYCVLAHAAFEEFVESISTLAAKATMSAWLAKKPYLGTQALLLFYNFKLNVVEDEAQPQERHFDQIREGLKNCIDKHRKALDKNHGFSLKYLRSVLTPVGIDIPDELNWLNSLSELTEARGSYAHKIAAEANFGRSRKAQRPMTPEKAKDAVQGCLELCRELKARHEKSLPA
jgi:hypothetical protein